MRDQPDLLDMPGQQTTDDANDFPGGYEALKIVAEQPPLYAFANPAGDIVLRQVAPVYDDNPHVRFRPEHATAICAAIMALAAKVGANGGAA